MSVYAYDMKKAENLARVRIRFHKVENVGTKQLFHVSFHHPFLELRMEYPSINAILVYNYGHKEWNKIQVDKETHLPRVSHFRCDSPCFKDIVDLEDLTIRLTSVLNMLDLPSYNDGLGLVSQDDLCFVKVSYDGLLDRHRIYVQDLFSGDNKFQVLGCKTELQQWTQQLLQDLRVDRVSLLTRHLRWLGEFALFSDLQDWGAIQRDQTGVKALCTLVLHDLLDKYTTIPKNTPLSRLLFPIN